MPTNLPAIVLASASPRRQTLLRMLGLSLTVRPQDVDETPRPTESPAEMVQRLSRMKAQALVEQLDADTPYLVIAADTDVALDNKTLGKPADAAEATAMLQRLRARRYHAVYSGVTVALVTPAESPRYVTRLHETKVWIRNYTDAEIAAYVASGDPLDKAGAYAIHHQGFAPVASLDGCFASVMGLPLGEVARAFEDLGLSLPDVAAPCRHYSGGVCCQG